MTEVRMTESRTLHVASISPRARRDVFVKRNDAFAVHTCWVCPLPPSRAETTPWLTLHISYSLSLPPTLAFLIPGGAFAFHCRFHWQLLVRLEFRLSSIVLQGDPTRTITSSYNCFSSIVESHWDDTLQPTTLHGRCYPTNYTPTLNDSLFRNSLKM